GLQAEEALAALDELTGERQAYVARLELLDDVILVAREVQFHLVLEIEGGLGVVAGVDLQLGANVAHQVQLDLLIEVERGDLPLVHRNARVLRFAGVHPEGDLGTALWPDIDVASPEDPAEGLAAHLDA